MSCRGSNDSNLKLWYNKYCRILTDVIKTEKINYEQLISKSKNKTKRHVELQKIGNNNYQKDKKTLNFITL